MNSREIEYIDRISFELNQIGKNLNELSAVIDVVDLEINELIRKINEELKEPYHHVRLKDLTRSGLFCH